VLAGSTDDDSVVFQSIPALPSTATDLLCHAVTRATVHRTYIRLRALASLLDESDRIEAEVANSIGWQVEW
jgi:hypothetical protein